MPEFIVFVEQTQHLPGTIRVKAETEEEAIHKVDAMIEQGTLEESGVAWAAEAADDDSGPHTTGDADNAEEVPSQAGP